MTRRANSGARAAVRSRSRPVAIETQRLGQALVVGRALFRIGEHDAGVGDAGDDGLDGFAGLAIAMVLERLDQPVTLAGRMLDAFAMRAKQLDPKQVIEVRWARAGRQMEKFRIGVETGRC
jgi:hypothetical protein